MVSFSQAYEAYTERLHDTVFSTEPEWITCDKCKEAFLDEECYESRLTEGKNFCSAECRDEFDEEIKHDYE